MTDYQTTHAHGCWGWGPRHYECALRKIERDEALLRQALTALERVQRDAADYIDDLIYLWPDGTWCSEEDLEEYLGFMSDDFEVRRVLAYDEHGNPCQTERT